MKNKTVIIENFIVRDIRSPSRYRRSIKQITKYVYSRWNPSKFNVIGLFDRNSKVVLALRYHNARDLQGRWVSVA
jgi:hypothetical protein